MSILFSIAPSPFSSSAQPAISSRIYIGNHRGTWLGWESEPPNPRQWVSTRKGWLDLSRFVERYCLKWRSSQAQVFFTCSQVKKRWKMIAPLLEIWCTGLSWWRKSWVSLWSTSYLIHTIGHGRMAVRERVRSWNTQEELRLEPLLHSVERSHLRWPRHVSDVPGCSPREVF